MAGIIIQPELLAEGVLQYSIHKHVYTYRPTGSEFVLEPHL